MNFQRIIGCVSKLYPLEQHNFGKQLRKKKLTEIGD